MSCLCCERCPKYYYCVKAGNDPKECCNECPYFDPDIEGNCRLVIEDEVMAMLKKASGS